MGNKQVNTYLDDDDDYDDIDKDNDNTNDDDDDEFSTKMFTLYNFFCYSPPPRKIETANSFFFVFISNMKNS